MTSPVGVITSGLALQLIAAPNSPAAGNVTLPRMSSSPATRQVGAVARDGLRVVELGRHRDRDRPAWPTSCPLVRDA